MQEIEISHIPANSVQIHSPRFRDMPNGDVEAVVKFKTQWEPYGYTNAVLCRATGTVYIYKVPKDEIIWLISAYGFLMCGSGKVQHDGTSFASLIQWGTNQEEPRNREAARIAKDLNGMFETDHSGTAVSFTHYVK